MDIFGYLFQLPHVVIHSEIRNSNSFTTTWDAALLRGAQTSRIK